MCGKMIRFRSASRSQTFSEADYPVGFLKAHRKVELQAVLVIEPAIAGEFAAALFQSPFFAFRQQFRSKSFPAVPFRDKYALQKPTGELSVPST